ncbi:MAG: NAD-dependent epimerase/dehydratase family protein, partial [Roseateles sp.]
MKILLTGATGLIGSRLLRQLLDAGHRVVCAGRSAPVIEHGRCSWLKLDFAATPTSVWVLHLQGVDAVVNLVGLFRESASATFAALHTSGPQALFDACASAGVRRVVQVSALGADRQAGTAFLLSKYEADRHLLALPLDACVAQPSLVFAPDGLSARRLLA